MKAPEAFRSISEVAAALGVPQHTLRAWETRFSFVKPVKRPDGRRYYRPSDVAMLAELDRLLRSERLSTEEIVRRHRAGGLIPTPSPDRSLISPLQVHLAALTALRERLNAAIG
jgi:DNA-binding transcriptional MerR regulator